jgi:hypothetical protein
MRTRLFPLATALLLCALLAVPTDAAGQARPSLARHLGMGALAGAGAGALAGLTVRLLCGSTCDHAEARTIGLYAVGGAAAGAGIGLALYSTGERRGAPRTAALHPGPRTLPETGVARLPACEIGPCRRRFPIMR